MAALVLTLALAALLHSPAGDLRSLRVTFANLPHDCVIEKRAATDGTNRISFALVCENDRPHGRQYRRPHRQKD